MKKEFNFRSFAILLVVYANKISSITEKNFEQDFKDQEQMEVIIERNLSFNGIGIRSQETIGSKIEIRAKPQIRYFHTKEEMELTKALPIIDNQPCNGVHPVSVFIHSAAQSSGKYFERRQTSRNTWVRELKNLNVSVYYAIALNKDQKINAELKEESDRHKDMIQFGFIDYYYNLTLKAVAILRWIDKNCLKTKHILKVDDDAIVNTRLLLDDLEVFKTGISGYLHKITHLHRDPKRISLNN